MTDKQFVYFFGEGTKDMKKLLGGKGRKSVGNDKYRACRFHQVLR